LLETLRGQVSGDVHLDIVGPVEDAHYFEECKRIIRALPPNVKVTHSGAMPWPIAMRRLVDSHFFVLPTLNENFGYVFIEALAAGCPVLLSEATPWSSVEKKNAGWAVPLVDMGLWSQRIAQCVEMGEEEFADMSHEARDFAVSWLNDPAVEHANLELLQLATRRRNTGE
jgi:glycosyltransferase involved in cell wall biosynthesis